MVILGECDATNQALSEECLQQARGRSGTERGRGMDKGQSGVVVVVVVVAVKKQTQPSERITCDRSMRLERDSSTKCLAG